MPPRAALRSRSSRVVVLIAGLAAPFAMTSSAVADEPQPKTTPNRSSTQREAGDTLPTPPTPKPQQLTAAHAVTPQPTKAALPVSLSIEAKTPDPPWTMKIENTG